MASRVSEDDGDWQASEWPALEGVACFVEEAPGDSALALDELVFDLNPGPFRLADQDAADAKKNGGIQRRLICHIFSAMVEAEGRGTNRRH